MFNKDKDKVKLHIQFEPYTGVKFDFIEVMTTIPDIVKVFNAFQEHLKELKNQNFYPKASSSVTVPRKDGNQPSSAQVRFARKLGVMNPETLSKQEISKAIESKLGK